MAHQEAFWPEEKSPEPWKNFRPIHYLGSKLRLAELIDLRIRDLVGSDGRAIDLFAGSGTISGVLARTRPVTAVDIQEYSRIICAAILTSTRPSANTGDQIVQEALSNPVNMELAWAAEPLVAYERQCMQESTIDPEPLRELVDAGPLISNGTVGVTAIRSAAQEAFSQTLQRFDGSHLLRGPQSVTTRHFGGVFFSIEQAVQLDSLLNVAHESNTSREVAVAAVLGAASQVVNTVGKQFAQPLRLANREGKTKYHLIKKVVLDRQMCVYSEFGRQIAAYASLPVNRFRHAAYRDDFAHFLDTYSSPVNIIYADPPYTRDHYSRYYHVLETMAIRDEPTVSRTNLEAGKAYSRGVYRSNRHQSPFCIKSQAPSAFEKLFSKCRRFNVPLLVSYSPYDKAAGAHPRMMTLDHLKAEALKHYRNVIVDSAGMFAHNKLNSSGKLLAASEEAEVLISCLP